MTRINPAQIDGTPLRELPLSALIQPTNDIVTASGLRSFTQRGTYAKGRMNYFLELGTASPLGEIRPLFPEWEDEDLLSDGWENVSFSLEMAMNKVTMVLEGFYQKPPVPVDVTLSITQGEGGYLKDTLDIFDRRTGRDNMTSLKEIMETRMKSGDFKYAGAKDKYGEMNLDRILKVLNRYLKDWALMNRIIERD
ncbi:hypothetical protein KKF84_16875 [Myxococcota bacterium]|nr:hypothetical protein [Myxococcota bacterium]MBU1537000.1 hypothetical protein [Myxococcota bacterium]